MICNDVAEYVSALCDGETIPPEASRHIAACPACAARLNDYLALGVELRRAASLELTDAVLQFVRTQPQSHLAVWWQKGLTTMRIPRLAFAVLVVGLAVAGSFLAADQLRAHTIGTVVLLRTVGPDGPVGDCPLSTQDPGQAACSSYVKIGTQGLAYEVTLLARREGRVRLAIRTRLWAPGQNLSAFTQNADPAARVRELWFEPGQQLNVAVPQIGTLTLTGEWLDHMPNLIGNQDLSPGPNEIRFARPLLLRDGKVVGDLASVIGGIFTTDEIGHAYAFYVPGQGRFLISSLPMKDAVEAQVTLNRISFHEDGHAWELVNGIPVTRAGQLWVLHQPDFRPGTFAERMGFSNPKLVQVEPGVWAPEGLSR